MLGNLTSKAGVSYTYPVSGITSVRPHAVSTVGGQSYSYDAAGNLTSGGGRTYAWNYDQQPTSITSGGVTETYASDAEGTRVKRTRGSTTVYIAGLIEFEPGSGITRWLYTFGGRVIALRQDRLVYGEELRYLHSDHLGSASYTTSATGAEVSKQDYTPWGARRGTADSG